VTNRVSYSCRRIVRLDLVQRALLRSQFELQCEGGVAPVLVAIKRSSGAREVVKRRLAFIFYSTIWQGL
jgi:hypothetical protein